MCTWAADGGLIEKPLLYAANAIVQGKGRYRCCLPAARWLSVISFLLWPTRSHLPTAPNVPKATQAYLKVIFIKTNPAAWGGRERAGGSCLYLLLYNYDTKQPVTFDTGLCCCCVFRQRCGEQYWKDQERRKKKIVYMAYCMIYAWPCVIYKLEVKKKELCDKRQSYYHFHHDACTVQQFTFSLWQNKLTA